MIDGVGLEEVVLAAVAGEFEFGTEAVGGAQGFRATARLESALG